MTLRRRTALVALAACAATTAGPALAASNVPVSLTAVGGSRQFDVVQAGSTAPLSSLDLGSTGSQSFRTRVRDTGYETLSRSYSVTATMSDLYLRRGNGTHDVATKVPSRQLSLSRGVLSADGLTATVLPRLSVSGTLRSCTDPVTRTALGLPVASTLSDLLGGLTGSLHTLCDALGTAGAPVTGTVDGALQQVTATVADVASLPNALTNGPGRSFDAADHSQDAVAQTDPAAAGAPAPTGVVVMTGAAATTLPAELVTALRTALSAKLAGTPLVDATDTGTTTLARLLDGVTSSTVRSAVAALSATQQAALLGTLTPTLLDPTLATVKDLTSTYYATPTLSAVRSAPVPGTYDGTLTLTFVQQ